MIFENVEKLDTVFFMKLTVSIYNAECCAHFLCFYVASCTYKRLPEFFLEWEKTQTEHSTPLTAIKRHAYICTAVLWVIMIISIAITAFLVLGTNMQDMMLVPLSPDHPHANIMKGVNLTVIAFQNIAWLAPSAFMFMVTNILSQEFNGLTSYIKELGYGDITKIKQTVEPIRRHHQRLCNIVGHADDIFSMQIAVTFSSSFLIACVFMYIMIYHEQPGVDPILLTLIETFWLVISLSRMSMDCVSGAMLNGAVSTYYRYMYRQTSSISRTKSLKSSVSRLVLQMLLPNPLRSGVKSGMKM